MKVFYQKDRRVFKDERGLIDNLLPDDVVIRSVARITGVKDVVRGNHWHKTDEHYCYVESGCLLYEYEEDGRPGWIFLSVGDVVYTPAKEKHKFVFLSEAVFYSFAIRPRDHDTYEGETVRENF